MEETGKKRALGRRRRRARNEGSRHNFALQKAAFPADSSPPDIAGLSVGRPGIEGSARNICGGETALAGGKEKKRDGLGW